MVTVRLRVGLSGSAGAWSAGELYVCDDRTAAQLLASEFADRVEEEATASPAVAILSPEAPPTTMQAAEAPERAVRPRGRPRTR
jgi:hypothetical protein